ncbi:hypothetical protein [Methylobacterium sp. E-045]|uniref:hypothetical protein n=1 Tax=Methylobacterium sp. E-045 TaxID=2836575 RepID=UPI001FBB15F8|nr:hypothetical protein [Methylobacterium sp. E-045]MCJ2131272.1 hypothetical protein [Methylobacterium sp. E-045]
MNYAQIPDFSLPLVPTTIVERVPFHADPVLAAIDAHDEAWSVWQAAPEARVAAALAEMSAALDRLLVTPCTTRFGSLTLLRHLRWHIQHDGITDAAVLARAGDLARALHLDFLPVTPPREPVAPILRALMSGAEVAAALVIVFGGMALVGLATLA